MLPPIHLYNQACFQAGKVDDVLVNWDLPAKAKPANLPLAQ